MEVIQSGSRNTNLHLIYITMGLLTTFFAEEVVLRDNLLVKWCLPIYTKPLSALVWTNIPWVGGLHLSSYGSNHLRAYPYPVYSLAAQDFLLYQTYTVQIPSARN